MMVNKIPLLLQTQRDHERFILVYLSNSEGIPSFYIGFGMLLEKSVYIR